ncbi:MAG TPA: HAD family phosphatase [Bryobacteraceae bacterium]|jgi:HAD superfamily hydrolase (TIGR01509 family)
MSRFDAILFDFDGVLADTEPVHWACWAQVLAPLGVILDWDFYRDYCIGIDDKDMLKMMATRSNPPRDWQDLWAQYPAKKELFRERTLFKPPFAPSLDEFLADLQRDYKLAVVSSSSCSEIEPLLVAGGLRAHFETLVGGETVKHLKPHPEPYRMAADRIGARAPLVVEDSEAGLASGRAAGFDVVRVRETASMPDVVAERLRTGRGVL